MKLKELFGNIQSVITKYDFPEEQKKALSAYAEAFCRNEKLISRAQEYYNLIFCSEDDSDITELFGDDSEEQGMLFAMIYLARLEKLESVLAEKGIDVKYAKPALWHYNDLFRRSKSYYGYSGFSGMYRKGMIQYIKPKTFRIGRLCFEMTTFSGPYTVYKNTVNGKTLPIINEGQCYMPDGKPAPRDCDGGCFTVNVSENADSIIGCTVYADGRLSPEKITLNKSEYIPILQKNDPVLSVHIPGGERLTPESTENSINRAKAFFKKHYGNVDFKAFVCSSWLLDTGLSEFLKAESNILAFQRKFNIVLSFVNTFSLYWNIFGVERFVPYSELTPTNDFQRKVLDFIKNGGSLYSGNGYFPFDN